jgi:hypothetical protein
VNLDPANIGRRPFPLAGDEVLAPFGGEVPYGVKMPRPAASADIAFCVAAYSLGMPDDAMASTLDSESLFRDPNPARKAAYIQRTMAKARLWANSSLSPLTSWPVTPPLANSPAALGPGSRQTAISGFFPASACAPKNVVAPLNPEPASAPKRPVNQSSRQSDESAIQRWLNLWEPGCVMQSPRNGDLVNGAAPESL